MLVLVLGMHRSGTSVTAGVLQKLGVDMGAPYVPDAEVQMWENFDFVDLNNRILKRAGGQWDVPPPAADVAAQAGYFADEINSLMTKYRRPFWGWKDPRTCLTLPVYRPFLDKELKFVITSRPNEAVVDSLVERDQRPAQSAWWLIEEYYRRIGDYLHEYEAPAFVVLYDMLVDLPASSIGLLVDFLGISPTDEQLGEAESLVDARLRRHSILTEGAGNAGTD